MASDIKQDIELGLARNEYYYPNTKFRAVLTIETGKGYSGGIESTATVFWVGNHSRDHAFGLGSSGGDFSRNLVRTSYTVRATQKAIERQHATVFTAEVVAVLTAKALAWYAEGKDKR